MCLIIDDMAMSTARCWIVAIATIALTGCQHSTPAAEPSTPSAEAGKPSAAYGPTQQEGVIEKKIGEPAGLNCPDDPAQQCDLYFNVTAIQQNAPCDPSDDPPGPNQQFLRFELQAFSERDTFEFSDTADALLLDHWSVEGAGDVVEHGLVRYAECDAGEAPIGKPMTPGVHARSTVVVRAPKPATVLRFSWADLVWEWTVPGAD